MGTPLTRKARQSQSSVTEAKSPSQEQPHAEPLNRFHGNPVLLPIIEHYWESRYVLNAAAVKLNSRVYMLYRAFGEDAISRIGLAVSNDGYTFNERLEKPIFAPANASESKGCEDPRITLIGDRLYMTYTAFDGMIPQIAMASITVKDFLDYRWHEWRRHGLFRPGCVNKDAAVFPELFDGEFVMLHRLEPNIWITTSCDMRFPWSYGGDRILARPNTGISWDSRKIGAGSQPIKTEYGWLLITHGVDYANVYRLGVLLLDLKDPFRLIYRSPNPILEPSHEFEIGAEGKCWVPNVVFTCGAVARENGKRVLSAHDELIVYYGGADTVMNAATAKVGDLIPLEMRNHPHGRHLN